MSKTFYSFLTIVAFCLFAHSNLHAQYKKGDNLLNAGVGLGVFTYGGIPIGASFEHGITEDISVGAFFDYLSWKNSYLSYSYSWRFMYFGARGSYHLNELLKLDNDKIDTYVGAGLGFRVVSTSDNLTTGYKGYGNGIFYHIHAGGRYYFANNLAGFAEVGYGIAALKVGLTLKF
jgi:hypothetical protein